MAKHDNLTSKTANRDHSAKNKILKLFAVIIFTCIPLLSIAQEITLFDSEGEARAYIDANDDLTIYLWAGTPVAYLVSNGDNYHIYGFNGKHLGWFEDGIIRDHNGYALGFIEGAVNMYTKYEPYKGYKKYKPYKSYKEYAPYKPYYKNSFSNTPLVLFLKMGE